jgi:hypothetical protein
LGCVWFGWWTAFLGYDGVSFFSAGMRKVVGGGALVIVELRVSVGLWSRRGATHPHF